MPLRTKRNFKALQLPTGPTLNQPPAAPHRLQSLPDSSHRSAIRATITQTIAGFPHRKNLELEDEKLDHLREIGQGNGGTVSLVRHRDADIIMAKKVVLIDAKPSVRKQIVRELQIMHECNSSYIIECYGSYLADPNICICMEYMDRGSFESIYKKMGPVPIEVVARVAMSVLEGLTYLYDVHRIIHRDIKPSNILCNTQGEIKLCDFGVSGELINSIANTFVGTSIYMSPERIQGAEYSVKSDIWSLGITLVELATGRFPFSDADEPDFATSHTTTTAATAIASQLPDLDEENVMIITAATASMQLNPYADSSSSTPTPTVTNTTHHAPPASHHHHHHHRHHTRRKSSGVSLHGGGKTMSIIELMHHIVREPAPRLPEGRFAKAAEEFVDACLEKQVEMRGIPGVLLKYSWVQDAKVSTFDIAAWACSFD